MCIQGKNFHVICLFLWWNLSSQNPNFCAGVINVTLNIAGNGNGEMRSWLVLRTCSDSWMLPLMFEIFQSLSAWLIINILLHIIYMAEYFVPLPLGLSVCLSVRLRFSFVWSLQKLGFCYYLKPVITISPDYILKWIRTGWRSEAEVVILIRRGPLWLQVFIPAKPSHTWFHLCKSVHLPHQSHRPFVDKIEDPWSKICNKFALVVFFVIEVRCLQDVFTL